MPVIGDLFTGIQSLTTTLVDMAKRIKTGKDATKCYRPVSLRTSHSIAKKPCPAEGITSSDTCYMPCPAGKLKYGNICLKECPTVDGVKWTSCGMLCTSTDMGCGMKQVWDTLDIYNAGSILAGFSSAGLATNFVWIVDSALRLVETFTFPDCGGQG